MAETGGACPHRFSLSRLTGASWAKTLYGGFGEAPANCGCRGGCGILCGEGRDGDMPYTVQKKDDSLELFVKFMETPEGEALFRKECEKLRQVREAEVRQKGLAAVS